MNAAIGRKSLMIDTAKFASDLSHHDNFLELSSHSKQNLSNDCSDVCDYIDADIFR